MTTTSSSTPSSSSPSSPSSFYYLYLAPILITLLLFPLLTTSLPLPVPPRNKTNNNTPTLEPGNGNGNGNSIHQARSPISDPRMIPTKTDLLAQIFAQLGMEEFNQFNKLHPEEQEQEQEHNDDGVTIDDGQGSNHTVTPYDNQTGEEGGSEEGSGSVRVEEHGGDTDGKGDAGEDAEGFMGVLFEVLRRKFREAMNSSDEVVLR
ncbi:hypothetical protein BDW59DRAFT_157576 [Aspergillus cavernicola]|uniref:Uncharacterized protein n=1 Tax=Aspergillus cavernicola TaxID=176166 RepID=A0ABR4IWH5_9EURO